MILSKELQELKDKRSNLENESLSLQEEQKKLEEKIITLEQKIIEELKSKNEKIRQNISDLKSTINDLEQILEQITRETRTYEPIDETAPQPPEPEATEAVTVEINKAALEGTVEEETVTGTTADDFSTT